VLAREIGTVAQEQNFSFEGWWPLIKKKPIQDLYNDASTDAVNNSSQARRWLGTLEPELNRLSWALPDLEKLAAEYKPSKVSAMSTYDPSVDNSDPAEHVRIVKLRMAQVRSNLASAKHDIEQLEQRYAKLLFPE
jgi:hypothetical protein